MLTKRQKQVLDFVRSFSKKHGYAPSLEEIKECLGLSSISTAHFHISNLKKLGLIRKIKNGPRTIEIKKKKSNLSSIPLLGTISAGGPIEAIRDPKRLKVPRNMLAKSGRHYALKVQGTSMIEEGISDGDIIIVREQPIVENGEKAVAYLPDKNQVTLKRIFKEKNRIKLQPANKTMQPFYEKNVEIQGKVVGVLRKEV